MNKKKPMRSHDPKIEPRPKELVEVTVEFTKDELRAIDELVRIDGYGSRDEFLRAATAQGIRSYRKKNR
jgi:metal-responsive CopG/Arc/MetJ family transcriptional regulator